MYSRRTLDIFMWGWASRWAEKEDFVKCSAVANAALKVVYSDGCREMAAHCHLYVQHVGYFGLFVIYFEYPYCYQTKFKLPSPRGCQGRGTLSMASSKRGKSDPWRSYFLIDLNLQSPPARVDVHGSSGSPFAEPGGSAALLQGLPINTCNNSSWAN